MKIMRTFFACLCALALCITVGMAAIQAVGNGGYTPTCYGAAATPSPAPTGQYGVQVCGQATAAPTQQPVYISTKNCCAVPITSYSTWTGTALGSTINAWVSMGTASLTTGVSTGPTGQWMVEMRLMGNSPNTTNPSAPCIAATPAGSSGGGMKIGSPPCSNTPPTNDVAGGNGSGVSTITDYIATYANNTTITVTCYVSPGATGMTNSGLCESIAYPI